MFSCVAFFIICGSSVIANQSQIGRSVASEPGSGRRYRSPWRAHPDKEVVIMIGAAAGIYQYTTYFLITGKRCTIFKHPFLPGPSVRSKQRLVTGSKASGTPLVASILFPNGSTCQSTNSTTIHQNLTGGASPVVADTTGFSMVFPTISRGTNSIEMLQQQPHYNNTRPNFPEQADDATIVNIHGANAAAVTVQ